MNSRFPAILMMKHWSDEESHDYSHIPALYFVQGYPEMVWQPISIALATVTERGECLDQVPTVCHRGASGLLVTVREDVHMALGCNKRRKAWLFGRRSLRLPMPSVEFFVRTWAILLKD